MNSFIVHTLLIRRRRSALLVVAPPGAEEGDDTSGHTGEQGQHKTSNSNTCCDTCIHAKVEMNHWSTDHMHESQHMAGINNKTILSTLKVLSRVMLPCIISRSSCKYKHKVY